MIDKWDIELFEKFLKLAKTEGTDAIKVVAGDTANTYKVSLFPVRADMTEGERWDAISIDHLVALRKAGMNKDLFLKSWADISGPGRTKLAKVIRDMVAKQG